jgi:hypothetical protein
MWDACERMSAVGQSSALDRRNFTREGGHVCMADLAPETALGILRQFHETLNLHFSDLRAQRAALEGSAPVFALEHGLAHADIGDLQAAVRAIVANGFRSRFWRDYWLPFVVYAAEVGHTYAGDEFWTTFESATPGWSAYGDRTRIRIWFQRFHAEYGGAFPEGAFAKNFSIIAWPITHAILPIYLQRNLAHLLFDFRMGLTSELLHQPAELGKALRARAWEYTERFRIFCENTSLLGHLAAALLSGEGDGSPYLLQSTLHRVVEGLEKESLAKYWLQGARRAASNVRARGFQSGGRTSARPPVPRERLQSPTDPRLVLRAGEEGWRLYAQLPDLSSLSMRLPHIYDEIRTKRALIEGADQTVLARGRLTTLGQEVRLARWPDADVPFLRLEGGDDRSNAIVRDQVMISRGPIWLFKRRGPGEAVEVKSRLVRPGGVYYVAHDGTWDAPDVPWAKRARLDASGADMTRLAVPDPLTEEESAALVASRLSVGSQVVVRPVGIAASAWDGEGAVEWLAGEPGLIGIRAEQTPASFTIELGDMLRTQAWPEGKQELFLRLDDLPVAGNELLVTLNGAEHQMIASGALAISVREPQVRAEGAEAGEGIRMFASPARPTMSELWQAGAISVLGPTGLNIDLHAILRDQAQRELVRVRHAVRLPLRESGWEAVSKKLRSDERVIRYFDQAESVEITVSKAGVGFAAVTADRGFQPLRWQLIRERDGNRAHLIDRTDSGSTRVEMYRVEAPLLRVDCAPDEDVIAPPTGGLVRATAGDGFDASTTVLLPTRPNDLIGTHRPPPKIQTGNKTLGEVTRLINGYRLWADADLPGDVIAQYQRDEVLSVITRTLVNLISGGRWATVEHKLVHVHDKLDLIEELQAAVGDNEEQKKVAKAIAYSLHAWRDPASLLTGFAEVIQTSIRNDGVTGHDSAPRFLLTLAGRPGLVMNWPPAQFGILIQAAITSPFLLRAARFAVLGTRLLDEADAEGGF